ncbi:MAG: hypothetical protein V3S89_14855, partial [Desulfobacterales bacterium]
LSVCIRVNPCPLIFLFSVGNLLMQAASLGMMADMGIIQQLPINAEESVRMACFRVKDPCWPQTTDW